MANPLSTDHSCSRTALTAPSCRRGHFAPCLPACLQPAAFIEIMAPVFSMAFFNGFVAPTLYNAHYGWGLDFIWCVWQSAALACRQLTAK